MFNNIPLKEFSINNLLKIKFDLDEPFSNPLEYNYDSTPRLDEWINRYPPEIDNDFLYSSIELFSESSDKFIGALIKCMQYDANIIKSMIYPQVVYILFLG